MTSNNEMNPAQVAASEERGEKRKFEETDEKNRLEELEKKLAEMGKTIDALVNWTFRHPVIGMDYSDEDLTPRSEIDYDETPTDCCSFERHRKDMVQGLQRVKLLEKVEVVQSFYRYEVDADNQHIMDHNGKLILRGDTNCWLNTSLIKVIGYAFPHVWKYEYPETGIRNIPMAMSV